MQSNFKLPKIFLSTLILLFLTVHYDLPTAFAQNSKIVTVDINAVLNSLSETKAKKQLLDSMAEKLKKEIETKRNELKAREAKLQANKVEMDSVEAENYRKSVRDFERLMKDREAEYKQSFLKINKELTEKALGYVNAYARKNSISLVLERSNLEIGPVLFNSPATDITTKIIDSING
jgi:Skp family chaperone for outer membrane proteins